ncbi:HD domain-containing protein [Alkaliphilus peptidifermentans]|uniref:HD domain-containing protein n=1 Tax=Alkaliphilus peptidifermentans DSM 18978 TaxID=1120976 RepID=A0A1G5HEY2_9FIRM|nr:HD domain-containing protein [Alkaliphilus peptidifermentans]SCY62412.1 uncharacterized protein SAMN03080606_01995 [Alkaliphilus peptidifermentans DSM 18978]
MKIDRKHKRILEIVNCQLSCSAHNLDHVLRVYNLCVLLAKHEKKVDLDVLIPSALLHDIARVKESQDETGKIDHAVLGSEMAEDILRDLKYDEEKIMKIKHCIIAHRFRTGNEPETIDAKILFDADKLDAIGATGIARSFMLAGQFGQRLVGNESMDKYEKENVVENGRLKNLSKHTPFIEYEVKFKKIPQKLYTKKAKELAIERLKFMEEYFARLKMEISNI